MAANHKLTALIKGRTISGTSNANNEMIIFFTDSSKMTVRTSGSSNSGSTGGTIEKVRQQDNELDLDMVGGSTLTIQMEAPTSSVMVRDKNGKLQYTD